MTWNHRVIVHEDGTLGIYEVYYDEKKRPYMWTEDAIVIGDNQEELLSELTQMTLCIAEEWLDINDLMDLPERDG